MTQTQSDRLKGVQRQYAEMEHNTATLQQAQQAAEKAAWVAENNYNSLTDKCREEFRVRQEVIEGLKFEWRMLLSMAVIGGAFGALAAGLTTQAARWLWDTFLAVLSSGWATLAAWWKLVKVRSSDSRSYSICRWAPDLPRGPVRHEGTDQIRVEAWRGRSILISP